jgi:hypothetical protein
LETTVVQKMRFSRIRCLHKNSVGPDSVKLCLCPDYIYIIKRKTNDFLSGFFTFLEPIKNVKVRIVLNFYLSRFALTTGPRASILERT